MSAISAGILESVTLTVTVSLSFAISKPSTAFSDQIATYVLSPVASAGIAVTIVCAGSFFSYQPAKLLKVFDFHYRIYPCPGHYIFDIEATEHIVLADAAI